MSRIARTPAQIGALLSRRRRQRGLTQAQLGDIAGLRQATVSRIEAGSEAARLETLCALLAGLDLELQIVQRSRSPESPVEPDD